MTIKEVPMWRVECDVCGEGNDDEYWAWNDHGHAVDCWIDSEHVALDDGTAYHRNCIPFESCLERGDGWDHVWMSDGTCDEGCGRTAKDVVDDSRRAAL